MMLAYEISGDGVNLNVCTPYHPQSSEPFCAVNGSQRASLSLRSDEQVPCELSEIFTGGSDELVNNCNNQVLSSKTLQDAVAGSRKPVVDIVSFFNFYSFCIFAFMIINMHNGPLCMSAARPFVRTSVLFNHRSDLNQIWRVGSYELEYQF